MKKNVYALPRKERTNYCVELSPDVQHMLRTCATKHQIPQYALLERFVRYLCSDETVITTVLNTELQP